MSRPNERIFCQCTHNRYMIILLSIEIMSVEKVVFMRFLNISFDSMLYPFPSHRYYICCDSYKTPAGLCFRFRIDWKLMDILHYKSSLQTIVCFVMDNNILYASSYRHFIIRMRLPYLRATTVWQKTFNKRSCFRLFCLWDGCFLCWIERFWTILGTCQQFAKSKMDLSVRCVKNSKIQLVRRSQRSIRENGNKRKTIFIIVTNNLLHPFFHFDIFFHYSNHSKLKRNGLRYQNNQIYHYPQYLPYLHTYHIVLKKSKHFWYFLQFFTFLRRKSTGTIVYRHLENLLIP